MLKKTVLPDSERLFLVLRYLIRAFFAEHDGKSPPQQHDVEPDIPVAHIPRIHGDALRIIHIAAAARLPHARNAGPDHVVVLDEAAVPRHFFLDDGTGADEAHFAFQDIENLRQFVQTGAAQEMAALRNARVVFQLEIAVPFFAGRWIPLQQFLELDVGVDAHAAELVAIEFLAVAAHTAVLEDDRTRGVMVDPEGNRQQDG